MRKCVLLFLFCALVFASAPAFATIFGAVRGIVHDPQHRPLSQASVKLQAITSDWSQTTQTDDNGEFSFTAVPVGDYKITVTESKFQTSEQTVTVASGSSPILHFQLAIATVNQTTVVTGQGEVANVDSVTPTALIEPPGHSGDSRRRPHQRPGNDHRLRAGCLRDPRHAAHARRPPGGLAD